MPIRAPNVLSSACITATILLWTDHVPDPLTTAFVSAGFTVWEALAYSEVTALCESEDISLIVIAAAVDDARYPELKQHYLRIPRKSITVPEGSRSGFRRIPIKGSEIRGRD